MSSEARRLALHHKLTIVTPKCYYTPREGIKMEYPCIVYSESTDLSRFANNAVYFNSTEYQIIVMSTDAIEASNIQDKVLSSFVYSKKETQYIKDNIYHKVVSVYQ